MKQESLFPLPEPKIDRKFIESFPDTSREAHKSINVEAEQQRVLTLLKRAGANGMTADEVEAAGGRGGHQRFSELRRRGLIRRTGIKRRTRAGKLAETYVVV